jgi:hypothetical protein
MNRVQTGRQILERFAGQLPGSESFISIEKMIDDAILEAQLVAKVIQEKETKEKIIETLPKFRTTIMNIRTL